MGTRVQSHDIPCFDLLVIKKNGTLVEMQIDKKVKCLWSNNGGEYGSKAFEEFCDAKGIKREFTAPYNPP